MKREQLLQHIARVNGMRMQDGEAALPRRLSDSALMYTRMISE